MTNRDHSYPCQYCDDLLVTDGHGCWVHVRSNQFSCADGLHNGVPLRRGTLKVSGSAVGRAFVAAKAKKAHAAKVVTNC